jgi:Putative prokaryotic signal transducing protein
MKTVAECTSVDEALVLRSLLEDCGIRSYVPDELSVTYRGQPGGFRLQVADEDAEAAKKILEGSKT